MYVSWYNTVGLESQGSRKLKVIQECQESSTVPETYHTTQLRQIGGLLGAMAKWLKCQTADAEVLGSSPNHGMEELSSSSFNHCFTLLGFSVLVFPRWSWNFL